jgi:tetratricopeptide (TPR) repeat protein
VNRWGIFLYQALLRQNAVSQEHTRFIGEWHRQPITISFLAQALRWRDPASGFWWLLFAAVICAAIALFRRNFAAAGFLIAAAYVGVSHLRFQALFAIVVIVAAGEIWKGFRAEAAWRWRLAIGALVLAFTLVRVTDVIDNHVHLANSEITTFGTGASWWYPEGAAQFVLQNHPPGEVFNTYDQGGFLMFRLYPEYRTYVDGRAVPFGMEFLDRLDPLLASGPDSADWDAEAQRRNIQTMILPAARYAGVETYPFVLVHNAASNEAFVEQHKIDCRNARLQPNARQQSDSALLYNFYANRAAIDFLLERDDDALESYRLALHIFGGDPNLHLGIGQLYQAEGKNDAAEREYRNSLELRPTDQGWYALARLYANEHRYEDAARAVKNSAALSYDPAPRYRALERLQKLMQTK